MELKEQKLIDHYVVSAQKAKITGYDGIELNMPVLKQESFSFDRPHDVKDIEELMYQFKLAAKIVKPIKEFCGRSFPVIMKAHVSHWVVNYIENQLTEEQFFLPLFTDNDLIEGLRELERAGFDGFNIEYKTSWNNWHMDELSKDGFLRLSQSIKKWVNIPVIIGGISSNLSNAADNIGEGFADAVEMDPKVNVNKAQAEHTDLNDDQYIPSYFWTA